MNDAWVRINRAKESVQRLHTTVATTDSSDMHGVDFESDPDGHVRILARVIKSPPQEWRLIIGDILVDLRSALDYAVYGLAVSHAGGREPKNPRAIEFPIARSSQWFASKGLPKISQLPKARAYIESVQPYQPGYGGDTCALWVLNELVGVNKHRFIPVVWHALHDTSLEFNIEGATIEDFVAYKIEGELKHGAKLATFRTAAKQQANVQIKAGISTHIAFEPGPPAFGHEAVTALNTFGEAVEDVVSNLATFL